MFPPEYFPAWSYFDRFSSSAPISASFPGQSSILIPHILASGLIFSFPLPPGEPSLFPNTPLALPALCLCWGGSSSKCLLSPCPCLPNATHNQDPLNASSLGCLPWSPSRTHLSPLDSNNIYYLMFPWKLAHSVLWYYCYFQMDIQLPERVLLLGLLCSPWVSSRLPCTSSYQ